MYIILKTVPGQIHGNIIDMKTQQIVIDVPEHVLLAEKTSAHSFGDELRLLAAVKFYELGRLSSGWAADLAGLSRVEFLLSLKKFNVFPLESELSELEKPNAF